MRKTLTALAVALAAAIVPASVTAQVRPFGRIEAGALNPDDPLNAVFAWGAGIGVSTRSGAILLRFVRQGWDRDFGSGRTHSRSYLLAAWEAIGQPMQPGMPRPFLRLGAGAMLHAPLRTTWALDAEVGLRFRLGSRLVAVGSLGDLAPWLPSEQAWYCNGFPVPACTRQSVPSAFQHNIGLLIGLEL